MSVNKSRPRTPKPVIRSTVRVRRADPGSTIIGVQHGPTEAEIRRAVREEFQSLLVQPRLPVPAVEPRDRVAESLFVCRSSRGAALGFAVNNSGLIVCPSAVAPVETAVHIGSRARLTIAPVRQGSLLSAVRVQRTTTGLLPAYREYPDFDEPLFTYNHAGDRVHVSVDAIFLDARIGDGAESLKITNAFSAWFDPTERLIGGPVLDESEEVMGIAVASSQTGFLIVQPWSTVEKCINMDAGT
jgi:hypothetical protein